MVIWVTGLSGAGKTTLCKALYQLLKPKVPELVLLDGDAVRAAVSGDLGYREAERFAHVQRVQAMTKLLSDQRLVVLVAVLYSHPDLLAWNRQHVREYFEVYLHASLTVLQQRDPKGLYAEAAGKQTPNVVGVDIPWHAPTMADLIINTDELEPPERLARRVIAAIPRLASQLNGA